MDAFEQVQNSGKSMKKFTNAAVVINSNVNWSILWAIYRCIITGKITSYTSVLAVGLPIYEEC